METKPPALLAILVGIPTPDVHDVAYEGSLEELRRLVKTLGNELVGPLSQKREGTSAAALLGSGKLAELAALTAGTRVIGSMAPPPKAARHVYGRNHRLVAGVTKVALHKGMQFNEVGSDVGCGDLNA
jgi:hypothetical protein